MQKIEIFSKKLNKNVVVKKQSANTVAMGWSNGGWSKSGGWNVIIQGQSQLLKIITVEDGIGF